jgi:hypothetical protein
VYVDADYKIIDAGKDPNRRVNEHAYNYEVDAVCIETIQSYGMAVGRTVFETCIWIGRFQQTALNGCGIVHLYARPAIFRAVTGQSKGGDAALRQALLTRFGGDKKGEPMNVLKGGGSDKRSAFAVAVYHLDGAKLGEW